MDNNSLNQWKVAINKRNAVLIAAVIILVALIYFNKGLFVAAMVNGSPISRLAVVSELENRSGKAALEALITQKLIEAEAKKQRIVISNEEIDASMKKIEEQVKAQGQTLDEALKAQGLTLDELKKQIMIQNEMEKLIADKLNITDDELKKYIADNKITIPKGQEADYENQLKEQLRQQKFSAEAKAFIGMLHEDAKIRYFVNY